LELPRQQKQPPQQLLQQTPPAPQLTSGGTSSTSSRASIPPLQAAQPEQQWEQESKHYSKEQQWQWQAQSTNFQRQPPQQQQYKLVQYSKGNSLTLALAAQPDGQYTLEKTKGVASAADLAAFGRRKQAKDGAAKAAKAAKEVPLLLRPFHPYYVRVKKMLQATFLPSGYPTSVGSNYLQYTLWQVRSWSETVSSIGIGGMGMVLARTSGACCRRLLSTEIASGQNLKQWVQLRTVCCWSCVHLL
jgi:hypothetical protein